MKQKSNSRKSFFYHWKLSQKLFLLFLAVGILPVTLIFGITLYRIVQKNSEMMRYAMDKNYDRVEQMMDNVPGKNYPYRFSDHSVRRSGCSIAQDRRRKFGTGTEKV